MSSRAPVRSVHPSYDARFTQVRFWTNWRIWRRALLYTLPFTILVIYCAYKYPEWTKEPLEFPEAIWEGDIDRVEWYFNNMFIDINAPIKGDREGRAPLHIAAGGNKTEMVRYLVEEKGARVDVLDGNGLTPLHYAALKMNPFSSDVLLRNGANADDQDKHGRTSLHMAAIQGDLTTAAVLIFNGDARAAIPDHDGRLAIEYAKAFHGGPTSPIAKQISGGKEAAEEVLLHRHLPRRIEYLPDELFDEEGRRLPPGKKRNTKRKAEAESEDPEERTRARIKAAKKLEDFNDDDDLPVVRPRVVQENQQIPKPVGSFSNSRASDSGSGSGQASAPPKAKRSKVLKDADEPLLNFDDEFEL